MIVTEQQALEAKSGVEAEIDAWPERNTKDEPLSQVLKLKKKIDWRGTAWLSSAVWRPDQKND